MSSKGKQRRIWIWVVVGLVILLVGARIAGQRHKGTGKVELPIAVRVMNPQVKPVFDVINVSGTVVAKEQANAFSKVPGKLLRYVKAEGDWVAKDEIIAWVERDEVGLTYEPSPVKAPIAGQIAQRYLEIGAAVSPSSGASGTPVALLVNPGQLEAEVNVVEKDAVRVRPGQEVRLRVESFPSETFQGAVARISPVIDPATRTMRVVVALPNSARLRAGMFADVDIIVGQKPQSLLLPQEALLKQNQQYFVYVVAGERVARRNVTPGWPQGAAMEIVDGLTPQDRVVVEGQTRLTENSRIQVTEGE
jgi:membrane fusion protein, multidrug efflux system